MRSHACLPLLVTLILAGCGNGTETAAPAPAPMTAAQVVAVSGNTVAFPGNRADYTISATASGFSVTDVAGGGAAVAVTASQRLQFADVNVALDVDGNGGKVYRVYRAAFARVPDAGGLGFWITAMDNGYSLDAVSEGFFSSQESIDMYGASPTNEALVTAVYANVLQRAPDPSGYAFWVGVLNTKAATRAQMLAAISESDENKALVLPAIATGFSYAPTARIAANTVPGAPVYGAASAGNGSASVAFSAPASDGGVAITSYRARCSGSGASYSATGSASPLLVTGLSNGVLYTCSVAATNSLGTSAESATGTVTPVTVVTVAGAPLIGAATVGNASASIAFTAPASNGGAAITGYTAACTSGAGNVSASGAASPISVTGMTNGTAYACSVTAQNTAGSSAASGMVLVTPVAPVVTTVPGAPALVSATGGNGTAALVFTAPASNGGAAISSYTASCTGGGATRTATGAASPLSVTALTNGTSYSCSVMAANAVGSSAASSALSVTPSAASSTTGHLYCPYSASVYNAPLNLTSTVSVACTSTVRTMSANGVPDHVTGTFGTANNPATIKAVTVNFSAYLNPAAAASTTSIAHVTGYANNGVKFDPATAESYQNAGVWKIEALNQSYFPFGVDSSNAHVQPDGSYHYHGMPEGLLTLLGKGQAMTLVGFALDGFPVYARYGYTTAADAASAIKVITSSYRLKTSPSSGRPSTSTVPMGTFTQDYEYVAGLGDLDECNGRTGVTPEFPNGIYHYFVTDGYPYIQRCVKGSQAPQGQRP